MSSWWPAEGSAADIVGGNPGALQGGATFAAGEVGQAFSFDGATGWVDIPNAAPFNPAGPFAVECWIKANPSQASGLFLIVDKSHGFTDSTGWLMQGGTDGTVSFGFGLGGGGALNFPAALTTNSVLDNQWHHLAGVFTGAAIQIYRDGVMEGSVAEAQLPVNNSRDVEIGRSWGGGSPTRFFNGLIDEVSYYNAALSPADVQAIYQAGSAGKCAPASVLWIAGNCSIGNSNYVTGGFLNAGVIRLESASCGVTSAITITNGALTNALNGLINVNPGSGGARTFAGSLENYGAFNDNYGMSFASNNAIIDNYGSFEIAAGQTLTISGQAQTFNQDAGALAIDGAVLFQGMQFNYNGGVISGNSVYLPQSLLGFGPNGTNAATFILAGHNANFTGDISSGQTVWLRGDSFVNDNGIIRPANGFKNAGTLQLESANGGYETDLILTNGQVTNAVGGVINFNAGAGGARFFQGNLWNAGTVNNNVNVSYNQTGAFITNQGAFIIAAAPTVTFLNQTFVQNAGTLQLMGGNIFSHCAFDFKGGAILSNAVYLPQSQLNLGPAGTNPATFILAGQGANFTGDIWPGQTVWLRGDSYVGDSGIIRPTNGFNNSGTLRLESANAGYETDLIMTNGAVVNTASGVIAINAGAGGSRYFRANLFNFGAFSNNTAVTFDQAGVTLDNEGLFVTAPGVPITFNNQTFSQNNGSLVLNGSDIFNHSTFNYGGGIILSNAIYLPQSQLNLSPAATNPATFILAGQSANFSGDIGPNETIWFRGDSTVGETSILRPAHGFKNAGLLRLESANAGYETDIVLTNGVLTNLAGGVVAINPGAGGLRYFRGSLQNFGAFSNNVPVGFDQSGATLDNEGLFVVGPSSTVTLAGQNFLQNAGALQLDGAMTLNSSTFDFRGGAVTGLNGAPYLISSALHLESTAVNPASFILAGSSSTLTGDIRAGQTIWLRGDNNTGGATITFTNGFSNAGALRLESFNQGWESSISVQNGSLTNTATGVININQGYGGPRNVTANITNNGTVNLNFGAVWTASRLFNFGAWNVNYTSTLSAPAGGAIWENDNALNVAAGQTLTLNGAGAPVFNQQSGFLTLDGGLTMNNGIFNYNGGAINGASATVYLQYSALHLTPTGTSPATFILTGTAGSAVTGDIRAGQTVWIRGDNNGGHTAVTVASGFRNQGALRLESFNQGWDSSLYLTSGVLTNLPGGMVTVNQGAGGPRTLGASFVNQGAFNVNWNLTVSGLNGVYENDGVFDIGTNETLTINNQNQTFNQNAGGILTIDGGANLTGITFNYNGGLINGQNNAVYLVDGNLNLGANALNPASFIVSQTGSVLTGDIKAGQSVWIRGDNSGGHTTLLATNGFRNSGNLRLESINQGWTSALSVTGGTLTNAAGGVIDVNLGANGPRGLSANIVNLGAVNINFSGSNPMLIGLAGGGFVNQGTFTLAGGQTASIAGQYSQTAGLTTLNGVLSTTNVISIQGGAMAGTGTISGNYQQGAGGALDVSLAGPVPSHLAISGVATLAGKLQVTLANSFVPTNGSAFTVLSAASLNGAFSSFDLPPLAGGLTWQVDYQAGAVVLSVPPAASTNNTRTISGVVTNTQGAPVAGATVYAYADPTVQTNLIINGGFETPSVGGSSYIIFAPGATNLTGWTVLGPSSVDISAGFLGAAEEGSQYFDPTGDLNSGGGGVSQTYPTVPGLSYNLIFFNGAYSLHNLNSLGVTNNGVFYSIPQPSSGPGLRWTRQVIPFVATSNFTTVAFINLSGFNSDDCDVDNVQVLPANFDDVLSGVTDANGHYQIAVSDGIWQVNVAGLTTLGYAETTNQTVTLNGGNAVVNFSAAPFSGQYYNVTLQSSPVAAGIITGGGTYAAQASVTVNAAPNSGAPWIFTGWSLNGVIVSTNSTYTFTLANDLTLVATFALPSFTVAASNNPAGAGSINGLGTFVWGSTAMLTANPVFGYAFQHWSDNNGVQIGAARTLAVTVLSNAALAAVYVPTNLAHVVTTATAPPGLAVPTGAGSYTNGQPALFTAPAAITNGLTYYTFAQFNLNGSFASASASFPWTFATTDLTNWALTAVYNAHSVLPLVASAFGNSNSPVGATANFTVSIRFDRSMLTSAPPVILLTNSASAAQPVVPLGGLWSTTSALNDTFTTGPILLTNGMDGTVAVFVSGAADLAGDVMVLTNAFNFTLDATPPVISGVSVNPLALTAIVTWNTSEPATSQVDYGPTAAYGSSTPLDGSLVTSHSVTISGLAPSTGYHFRAGSHDLAGNAAASIDGSFTTLPAPDLQITNLTISPNLLSGGQATVSWIVTNTGTGATFNYWYDQVTVSNTLTGQTYFNTSVYYDPGASASIAGGGSRARQASFRLPDGTNGAGPLAVVVTANFYGSQYEINYANNTAAINAAATLALYPDLQILALAVRPSAPHSGDSVDVVWQDTNAGLGAIGAAFQDSVIVSNTATGAILVNGAVTYDAAASGAIGGGQTVARQFTFQLPNGAAGVGAWQIMVTADSGNTIFEYNLAGTAENNNTAAVSAASSLAPYADFVATNVQIGAGPFVSGGSAPISWTDFNFGTTAVAAPWTDNIYLSTDGTTNTSQLIGSFTFSNGLAAGSSRLLNETITLPPFVTGTAWIVVKANAANSVYELNTSNNAAVSAASFTIADTLAFGLSRTTFAKDAVNPAALGTITRNGGTGAPLTLSLASSDPGAVAVPSTVVMLAGQASVLFPISAVNDGIVHGTRQVTVTASAGGYASVSNNLTVLDSTVPALSLTISSNSIGDSFTNPIPCVVARNTSTASSLTVNLLADAKRLTVPATVIIPAGAASVAFNAYAVNDHLPHVNSDVTVTPTAPGFLNYPGSITIIDDDESALTLNFHDTVISKGAANPATQGTLLVNPAITQAVTVILISSSPAISLPPFVSVPANQTNVTFPINVVQDGIVTGTQTAAVTAHLADIVLGVPLDAGATNSIAVTDNNGPALTVTLAAKLIPESGATTGTVTRNTAPTSDLSVSLSSSVPNAASVPASVIIPNGETSASFPVTGVNPGFPTGTRTVDITAAAGGYGTGVGSLDVSDINLPDLVVSGFSLPAAGLSGSNVTVTYTVSNVGIAPTIGSWLDNVWYSLAPDGSNPKQIGQFFFNKGPLGVGQSYSNSASFNLPFNVGPIYIVVTTDIANTANESSFFNNTAISTNTISVSPYYSATVQADLHQAVSPTPIPMHGHAFLTSNPAQPAANVPVTIRILTKGTRRTYDVNADQNGNFTFTFQPIPSEAGLYVVGADYPYVPQDPAQDQFDLYGMRITDQQISLTATPATNFSGASTLINLGDQPLTGLTAAVYGLPPGISVDAAVTNQMAGGANADLVYSVTTSAFTQPLSGRAYIQVNSDQGAVAYLPLFLTLTPPEPLLAAVPGNLETPMLVGQQTFVDFDIQNIGGAATGPIQMQLPSAPWLGTLNSTNMPSLNPGESNRVTIALTPDAALALQFYNGNIFFGSANSSLIVPFSFRAISSATGNLQVTVQDEYTFYVAGAPNVTNATVTLFDPYSGDAIATNLTDAVTGVAMFTNIPAGTYNISVSAPKHDGFKSSTTIRPGQTAQMTPFISRQTVTIDWTVVPTTVEDTYQVVLQSDFETEVPIPVVTIDNPTIIPLMIENEDTVVHFEVSNHGLIAAEQVNIEVPDDDPDYIYKPLVNYMQEIPAMSTIDLPMVISWRSNSPTLMKMSQAPHGPGKTDFLKFDCQPLPNISVKWGIYCGNDFHWHTIPQELIMTPVEHDCFDSLKKKIQEGIDDPGAVAEALTSLAETAEKNLAKAFGSAGCSLLDTLAECPPLASRPCLTTILKITCGVATEDVKGAITAALHFGECWCPDSPPQLPQLNLTTSGGGRPPAPDGCLLCFSSGGGSGGSSGGGGGPGCWLCDWQPPVWDWPTCIPGMHIGDTTQLLAVHKNDAPPTTSAGDVCAHVRIEIDQQVTITRSAFKGTLNVDNNDPTNALTSVQITLAITDDSGAPATNLFGIVTSGLTGIGAVDGTGTIAPSATGTAVFTFTPTHDAAPVAMKHYKIGGTLTYVQNGTTVSTELLPQDIYVYPDPLLNLDYFLQRDVIADDPNQPGTIQPQPFYLGLMVNNKGYGKALNFTVTSAQPKIVENSKGLLINFQLTGASVGANPISPSLTANFGEIDPMTTTVGTWQMTCTLAGKFIDYSATFQHVNELGNPQTSIIDSVNIHEMIHVIKDVRPGQDDVPDFLVNDVPDSGHLPDTVYLSDGTTNSVAIITGGSSDGPITPTHMQAVVTAPMTAGWGYAVVPDPGPGYRLYRAVRSDGLDMKAPFNVWTTPLSFPASQTGAVHENLAHIVDFGGPGSYNLYYHTTNTVAPTIVQMSGPATFVQSGPISSAQIVFSEPIDLSTFDYHALNLSLNGGANLITSNVTVTPTSGSTYAINNLFALTGAAGNYTLTFNGAAVQDAGGNNIAGPTTAAVSWANGNAPVVVQSIDAVTPNTRNTPVTALNVTFDKPLNAATFDYHDLTLTQNGTNVALTSVTITPVTAAMFQISGLAPLTGSDGNYVLTVNATGVEDTGNAPGAGSLSVSWTLLTVGPTIVNTQYVQSPRNIVVQALDVTFSHAIDPATFDYHDINLTFNGGPNLITPVVTVTPISPTVYEIRNFNWVSGNDGAYSLTVDAGGIADLAGNAGTGTANVAWQMSTHIPDPPFNFAISPDTGVYAHDGVTASNSVTLSGAINGANLTVHVNDQTTGQNYGMIATTNGAFYLPLTLTKGAHYLQLYTVDAAANTSSNVYYDIFLDNSALSAVVDAVTPNPRTTPVTNLNITFSEPIDTNTFHLTNITVTLNGSNTLTPTLTMVSSNVFRVGGLAPLTAGVGAYQVAVNLNGVIDQAGVGGSNLVTQSWARTLSATNIPVIAAIPNHTIAAKTTLRVTPLVTDPAVPPLVLTYSLLPGAPTGATIDPATGAFQWTPTPAQANTTNQITIKVADNGNPQQTATQSFTVVVQNNLQLLIGSAIVYGGSSSNVAIGLNAETTLTNLTFLVTVPTNLFSSLALQANTPQLAAASILPAGSNIWQVKLAANPGQTFGAMPQMAFLNFTASNQSAIVPLSAQAMQPANADGSTPTNIVAEAGRIVIVGSTPLIEALTFGPATNHQRSLTLYGFPGSSYAIQSSPDLVHWTDAFRVPLTNMTEVLTNLNNKLGSLFLRADQFVTVAPVVDIMKTTVNNAEQLVLYGAPGAAYEVDYSVGLGAPWNLLMRIPMTNAFQFVSGLSAANQTLFYRFNLLNAEPPILDANLSDGGRSLIAYGRPGTNYILQFATNLAGRAAWQDWTNFSSTNAFQSFTNLGGAAPTIFYRLERH